MCVGALINIGEFEFAIQHLNLVADSGAETLNVLQPLKLAYTKNYDRDNENSLKTESSPSKTRLP